MAESVEIFFPEDHPTAAGHFPGNPILPGALLLDSILLAIARGAGPRAVTVRTTKFLRPARPGDGLRIEWERKGADIHFTCSLAASGEIAATGILRLGDTPE